MLDSRDFISCRLMRARPAHTEITEELDGRPGGRDGCVIRHGVNLGGA